MVEVSRHETFPDRSAEALAGLDGGIGARVDRAVDDPDTLSPLFLRALRRLGHRSVLDPSGGSAETWDSLVFASEVGAAVFAVAAAAPGAEVTCRLGGEVVALRGTGPVRYATAENWLTTMWLAVLVRDADAVERHTAVPVEVLKGSGAAEPHYLVPMVRMLQLFFRLESGADRELNSAVGHGDPAEFADPVAREVAVRISYPQQRLFHYFLVDHSDEQFNDTLAQALRHHRAYWTASGDRADSPSGYLALGPLALTAVAHDAGTVITVRSDYLPTGLYDGSAFAAHG